MGLYSELPDALNEVDVIIIGGGTAGCVVAARLADSNSQLSILVIEGGSNNYNLPTIIHPALYQSNFAPGATTTLLMGSGEPQLADRAMVTPVASVLGGGSSVNGVIYARAQRSDYDSWGVEGWSSEELIPFMRRCETYHGPDPSETHGQDGPVSISRGTYHGKALPDDFIASMNYNGYKTAEDLQNLQSVNSVSTARRFVSTDGRRQDVAHTYLHPRLNDGSREGLHVLLESKVIRILFDEDKRAIGVEYQPSSAHQADQHPTTSRTIKAKRMVVVSAGTCSTPLILERSGIGCSEVLGNASVPVVHNLSGVGSDFQDHQMSLYPYQSSIPKEEAEMARNGAKSTPELLEKGADILSWNGADASSKIRPSESDVDSLGRNFRRVWDQDFKNVPDKPLASLVLVSGEPGNPAGFPPAQTFSIGCYIPYPYSRGHIHITGPKLEDPIDFRTGYLSDSYDIDLKTHVWVYKRQRQIAWGMDLYRGEVHSRSPHFSEDSGKSYSEGHQDDNHTLQTRGQVDLKYSPEDDKVIESWLRENVTGAFHGLGTCKMAPEEQMGVVDHNLNVHGVRGLKVADLSICPRNVSANTNSTALMIGEKAADIIIKEL